MHASAANFTWGNTASSCVAVLPISSSELPVFWWTPGPPCNGCYVPFFVHGRKLPEIVSTAGTFGKRVMPADVAGEDKFSAHSYWWLFRELMDRVKGHPITALPGFYPARNQVVRRKFDLLEEEFAAETPVVISAALAATVPDATAALLDDFTGRCVQKVLSVLEELLADFAVDHA